MDQWSLGFKRVTPENWLSSDETWRNIVGYMDEEDFAGWYAEVAAFELANAPKEVEALFAVAKTTFVYAWLFYPFLAVAADHLYKVLEAAARLKCVALGLESRMSLDRTITALHKQGALSDDQARDWHTIRHLRNHASHPYFQTIQPPNMAVSALSDAHRMLNELFA